MLAGSILRSRIFTFVVGSEKKEYTVHETALSQLSEPLCVLLTGPHKEAEECRVDWPDVEEKTFVRFIEWAYTQTYTTAEPDIMHIDESDVSTAMSFEDEGETASTTSPMHGVQAEAPVYSLESLMSSQSKAQDSNYCHNSACDHYMVTTRESSQYSGSVTCLNCSRSFNSSRCQTCNSAFRNCSTCNPNSTKTYFTSCPSTQCSNFNKKGRSLSKGVKPTCHRCQKEFTTTCCKKCDTAFADCPSCCPPTATERRKTFIKQFTDTQGTSFTSPTADFAPRQNTESREDYTPIFLCHARLYVLGDIYDVPELRRLSLHRLHATLRDFILYPSRLGDIAALASYVFRNTTEGDVIRDMISLYYACVVEDASRFDGLKSLVDEIPDFAFGLISRMSERLE